MSEDDVSCLKMMYDVLRCYKMLRKLTCFAKMSENAENILIRSNPVSLGVFYTKIHWEFIVNAS